jgi:hypothetical protein
MALWPHMALMGRYGPHMTRARTGVQTYNICRQAYVPDSEGTRLRLELHQDQYTVVVYPHRYLPNSDRETVTQAAAVWNCQPVTTLAVLA